MLKLLFYSSGRVGLDTNMPTPDAKFSVSLQAWCSTSSPVHVGSFLEFGYDKKSAKGPQHWGDLKEEWSACKKGKTQSPIDLSTNRVELIPKLGGLKYWSYKPQHATVRNMGNIVQVNWVGDAGSIEINGTHFFLQNAHWHWPAEHTINGRRYDLELHIVHVSPQPDGTNKTAVIGVLYKYGSPDPFLSKLGKDILEIPEKDDEKSVGVIDPSEMMRGSKMYYRYMGSLTAPPCTQGIIWTVDKKIRTVSRGQVKLFKDAYAKENARPLQPINQREIQLYFQMPKNKPQY
ncbi:hypothetical protein Fmac_006387 [Flemingia macrophylla]|uniref:Alpha-carbonic anhydrase domain-containing protein n=1 Tax=Flemingia macrophylla TaxID=520843 RepID=A0ABD1NAG1_9FABA